MPSGVTVVRSPVIIVSGTQRMSKHASSAIKQKGMKSKKAKTGKTKKTDKSAATDKKTKRHSKKVKARKITFTVKASDLA
jgi:hypothetical protein